MSVVVYDEKRFRIICHMTYVWYYKLWPRFVTPRGNFDIKRHLIRDLLDESFRLCYSNVNYGKVENFRLWPLTLGFGPGGWKLIGFLSLTIVTYIQIWVKSADAFLSYRAYRQTDWQTRQSQYLLTLCFQLRNNGCISIAVNCVITFSTNFILTSKQLFFVEITSIKNSLVLWENIIWLCPNKYRNEN